MKQSSPASNIGSQLQSVRPGVGFQLSIATNYKHLHDQATALGAGSQQVAEPQGETLLLLLGGETWVHTRGVCKIGTLKTGFRVPDKNTWSQGG